MAQTYSFGDILAGRVPANNVSTYTSPAQELTNAGYSPSAVSSYSGMVTTPEQALKKLTPEQRQFLWKSYGHTGTAPADYVGEPGNTTGRTQQQIEQSQPSVPASTPAPTSEPASAPVAQTPQQPVKSMAQSLMETAINSYNDLLKAYNERLNKFTTTNPFNFDDVLKDETTKVAQRLDPYYTQTLGDFLQGINLKRGRSVEDARNLLGELNSQAESYTKENKMTLDNALKKSSEGFADSGLSSSGEALADRGAKTTSSNMSLTNYLRGNTYSQNQAKIDQGRTAEDLNLQESIQRRNLKQEQEYNTQSQALTAAQQDQSKYNVEKATAVGSPPGVNPLDYSKYSYNLLTA